MNATELKNALEECVIENLKSGNFTAVESYPNTDMYDITIGDFKMIYYKTYTIGNQLHVPWVNDCVIRIDDDIDRMVQKKANALKNIEKYKKEIKKLEEITKWEKMKN